MVDDLCSNRVVVFVAHNISVKLVPAILGTRNVPDGTE